MDHEKLATVYFLKEDSAEQDFHDYVELLGFLTEFETDVDYIKWH